MVNTDTYLSTKYIDKCKVSKSLLVENGDVVKLSNQDNTKIIDKVFSGRNVMRGKINFINR